MEPFGFEIGNFAAESASLMYTSPEAGVLLTHILDYHKVRLAHSSLQTGRSSARIHGVSPLAMPHIGSSRRSHQRPRALAARHGVCRPRHRGGGAPRAGVPRVWLSQDAARLPKYFSGEDPLLVEAFPELAALRDIFFTLKMFMEEDGAALPSSDSGSRSMRSCTGSGA